MAKIWVETEKCLGCKSCELACAVARDSAGGKLAEAVGETPLPAPRVRVTGGNRGCMPVQCRQCEDAPCLAVCPAGALQRDERTGSIRVAGDLCCGCFMCVTVCPFGAVFPTRVGNTVMKCDGCYGMDQPACVAACPTHALRRYEDEELEEMLKVRRAAAVDSEMAKSSDGTTSAKL